jgi:hypothetical protein
MMKVSLKFIENIMQFCQSISLDIEPGADVAKGHWCTNVHPIITVFVNLYH